MSRSVDELSEFRDMAIIEVHREDVKALLRKRYGSVEASPAAQELGSQAGTAAGGPEEG